MRKVLNAVAPLLLLAVLVAAWEIACRALQVPTYFLPAPSQVAKAAAADPGSLLVSAWRTLEMALMALAVVSILGTGLALAVAGSAAGDE